MKATTKKLICSTCPFSEYNFRIILKMRVGLTCGKLFEETDKTCGCALEIKTKLPMFDCPQSKWNTLELRHALEINLTNLMRRFRMEDGSLVKTNCPKENLLLLSKYSQDKYGFLQIDVLRNKVMDEGYALEILDTSAIKSPEKN